MEVREEACAGTYRFEIDLMQTVQIDTCRWLSIFSESEASPWPSGSGRLSRSGGLKWQKKQTPCELSITIIMTVHIIDHQCKMYGSQNGKAATALKR